MRKQEAVLKQLTEKGNEDYHTLLNTFIRIYNGEEPKWVWDKEHIFLGFGKLGFKDKEELLPWILCLRWLIGGQIKGEIRKTKYSDGSSKEKEIITYVEVG